MKVRLELAHKKAKVKKVLLKSDTVIGRSTECGLRIASNEVSRQHCKICIGEDGVTVRDLGSSNGTFVNGYQLEPETDYEIAPDSELSLGGIKFFVRFSEPADKSMQADGLGSTVDLKPDQYEAMEETVSLDSVNDDWPAEASNDDMEFAEAEDVAEEPPEEAQAEVGPETVPMALPAGLDSSLREGADVEMSTHGDSAILEREDENTPVPEPAAFPTSEVEGTAESPETTETDAASADLESEQPEEAVTEQEKVDVELEEEAEEPIPQREDAEPETQEVPTLETEDVVYEAARETGEEDVVYEAEDEIGEEEPALEEDSETAETDVAEEGSASEDTDEDDVAAFLNQVAEDEAGDDDESLGDFFRQFDN